VTHKTTKAALSKVKKPVPSVKAITAEMERLHTARAETNARYKQHVAKLKEMQTIRKNLYSITRQSKGREHSKNNDLSM